MESELISDLPMDVSFWGLVLQADTIVKIVMLILLIASIWSWSIIIEKTKRFFLLKKQANAFEETFWSGESLEKLYKEEEKSPQHPLATVFVAGMYEWTRASNSNSLSNEKIQAGLQERIHQVMNVAVTRELENVEKNIGFLATVGSTAPFIGLFGTVWGIMNSFKSIAVAQNTNLSVVAPGIAEALFATALGLFVAIPAVVAYNKISSDLSKYFISLETFMDEFTTIFFRQLEKK